jgi:hypothetical protein
MTDIVQEARQWALAQFVDQFASALHEAERTDRTTVGIVLGLDHARAILAALRRAAPAAAVELRDDAGNLLSSAPVPCPRP